MAPDLSFMKMCQRAVAWLQVFNGGCDVLEDGARFRTVDPHDQLHVKGSCAWAVPRVGLELQPGSGGPPLWLWLLKLGVLL